VTKFTMATMTIVMTLATIGNRPIATPSVTPPVLRPRFTSTSAM
jgi:hypothetical protein